MQTMPPAEIVLVLDPDENLVSLLKSRMPSTVRIMTSERFGLSEARNCGVKNTTGEIVAFIDDDAVAAVDWLEKLVQVYDDPSVVAVGGSIIPLWKGRRPIWFPEELYWIVGCSYRGLPERRALVRNPIGCNMSFRRSIFKKVGFFRCDVGRFGKTLLASEETEFSIRILQKSPHSKIIYDPSAIVYHRVGKNRANLKYLWKRSFYEGVSKAIITRRVHLSTLTTEDNYLRFLAEVSIPSRLRKVYKPQKLSQLLVLLFSISAVLAGFCLTKFLRRQTYRNNS